MDKQSLQLLRDAFKKASSDLPLLQRVAMSNLRILCMGSAANSGFAADTVEQAPRCVNQLDVHFERPIAALQHSRLAQTAQPG